MTIAVFLSRLLGVYNYKEQKTFLKMNKKEGCCCKKEQIQEEYG